MENELGNDDFLQFFMKDKKILVAIAKGLAAGKTVLVCHKDGTPRRKILGAGVSTVSDIPYYSFINVNDDDEEPCPSFFTQNDRVKIE